MNCEEAEELLGAYALDALPAEEMASVRAHLASCAEHAAKAAELRAVAATIGESVEEIQPPERLRGRIAAAVAETPASGRADNAERVALLPRTETRQVPRRFVGLTAPAWGAIAAVLAIAVAGLLAWNVALRNGDGGSDARVQAVTTLQVDSGAAAGYVVLFDDGTATIFGEAMPRLDTAQAYQLWSLDELGQPTSLGLMEYDASGVANASVSLDSETAAQIAVTIEPAGGSAAPTSTPIAIADL